MKHFTFEQLPDAVSQLYEKMEHIEIFFKKVDSTSKNNDFSQNFSFQSKCSSHYNKSDLAQLFYILMDENILFFDVKSEKYNRSKMQQFVEGNFTYTGDAGFQVSIDTISKQFSESKGFTYSEKQLKFLDKIIWLFQKRREKLAGR
jgi:hypothetical protein